LIILRHQSELSLPIDALNRENTVVFHVGKHIYTRSKSFEIISYHRNIHKLGLNPEFESLTIPRIEIPVEYCPNVPDSAVGAKSEKNGRKDMFSLPEFRSSGKS
jgi:hypothetical protein